MVWPVDFLLYSNCTAGRGKVYDYWVLQGLPEKPPNSTC